MNQGRVIDHQVLKYDYNRYTKRWTEEKKWLNEGSTDLIKRKETYIEEGEEEWFEYLIKVEISKGWTPQGDYFQRNRQYCQTMVKYEGFVTSNPPPPPPKMWIRRYENGYLLDISLINKNGKRHGLYKSLHHNGQLSNKGNYKNGKKDGLWEEFHKDDGKLTKKINYKNGVIKSQEVFKRKRKLGCFFYFCLFVGLVVFLWNWSWL